MTQTRAQMSRLFVLAASCISLSSYGRLTVLNITSREPLLNGTPFGEVGPYEKIRGVALFELDPWDTHNQLVFDIDKVQLSERGTVQLLADFYIMKPLDPVRGNDTVIFEPCARGNKLIFRGLNDVSDELVPFGSAEANDPTTLAALGNTFLQRSGYTVVWVGWEAGVTIGSNRLTATIPLALDDGYPLIEKTITEISDASGLAGRTLSYPAISIDPIQADVNFA